MALRLTDRQVVAAAADDSFVNIVSAPGSGKTTVAAERFGYLHLRREDDPRGVLGLSFNRTAVAGLSARISARWGVQTTRRPNLITTFDDLHERLLHHLLATGLVQWPTGAIRVEVLDEYRGLKGFRYLPSANWRRVARCRPGGLVFSDGRRVNDPRNGIGGKGDHVAILDANRVSHEDVRSILKSAVRLPGVEDALLDWFRLRFRHVVVDEIYDADELDLWMTACAGEAGGGITVVGDPWQALYGWRGATPEKVKQLLDAFPFRHFNQPESFRFRGPQMPDLTTRLRNGDGVSIPSGSSHDVDVALAHRWTQLWQVGANVLPLAFRTIGNATDACMNLLLDEVTRRKIGRHAFGKQSAYVFLGIDPETPAARQSEVLGPVLAAMKEGEPAASVLSKLRAAVVTLGAGRRPVRLAAAAEAIRVAEIDRLRQRLTRDDLIPGLTVHQAKGCEWPRVGVALSTTSKTTLAGGLAELVPDHCVLYVALTRAMETCVALGADAELEYGSDGNAVTL